MNKFDVDFKALSNKVDEPKRFLLKDVQDKIEKVAFDVVRFVDSDNIDNLWQVKTMDDGKEYIIAMYDVNSADDSVNQKSSSDWSVMLNKHASNVSVYYKETPVTKISLASVGIPLEEADLMCRYLPSKLQGDKKLASALLNTVPLEVRNRLFELHPELKVK